jgi:general secretion pathway protein E
VQRQTGVGFAAALRAILRQDPDVVLIGEMRDRETAEIAIQAAMTGHLVLTTLHTNTALGAIPRLRDIGIAEYLIASTLEGILAQRLLRRLCPACATPGEPDPRRVAALLERPIGRVEVRVAVGCELCRHTGYRGRVGIFEYVPVDEDLRAAIARGATAGDLEAIVRNGGGRFMNEHGWSLIDAGLTTVDEVLRVLKH